MPRAPPRPAQGQEARAASGRPARNAAAAIGARSDAAASPTLTASFRANPRTSGSRSASAAANISSPKPKRNPDFGFIGCEFFENGLAKALALIEAEETRQYPPLLRRRGRGHRRAARGSLARRLSALSRSLAEAAAAQAAVSLGRQCSPRSPAICAPGAKLRFATDIDDNAGWTLGARSAVARFRLACADGGSTGASLAGMGRDPL